MNNIKQEKLQKKIKNCFENQHFFSVFEDAIDKVKGYFIMGGIFVSGVAILFGFTPPVLLLGSLVAIFSPIVSVTFARIMQQFYKDRGEVLRDKLYKLEETVVEETIQKETTISLVKQTNKNKNLYNSKTKKYFNKKNIKEKKEQDDSLEK